MYNKITVATDGSSMGGKAVIAAAQLAKMCDADLTIAHVLMHGEPPESLVRMAEVEHLVTDHPQIQTALDNIPGQMAAATADTKHHRLDDAVIGVMGDAVVDRAKAAAVATGATTVNTEVLTGDTADQIIDAVNRHNSDLVVVGTRGLGPLKGLLMGSVSQKISQLANCACLVIK